MLKKAILLLLALYSCIATHAQTSCTNSLSGIITDATGNPLPGAAIILSPGDVGQSSDAEGHYAFNDLCAGTYQLKLQYVGHQDISLRLRVNGNVERNFTLEEDVTELNEVVIQHHDAANTEHATNFAELDERKLAENAGKTLGETLREIPGVTSLQTGPGIFKPVIHGVHSQRLLILNHGIRQEGQQWGAEHAPEIDPFIASNIVVVKDASAIKYGTDALGGVIVVNPAPLPETNNVGGTLTTVFQSNGRSGTISGMLEGGVENHNGWGWRVQGTAKRTGDFETPDYVLTNTGVKELNFSAATGYHAKKHGFDLFFSRFQSELGILRGTAIGNMDDLVSAMERDVPLYTSDFSYHIHEPRQEVSHNLVKLNGHLSGASGELRFQYGFQNNNRREFDLRIGDLSAIPAIDLQLNTHTLDTEWETHHSDRRTFSFGLNTMYQTNRNIPGTQRIPFIPNFDNISGGAFATSKFFLDKWTIDAGVRYDYRNYSVKGFDFKNSRYAANFNFHNVSASLGITREVTTEQSVNLSVSTAWRPPHVSELYSVGTHQSAAAIEYGLMLDPETNEVLDIMGVKFSPEQAVKSVASYQIREDRLQFTVTPYANYIINYIYLRPQGITRNVRGVYPYLRYNQTDALFLGIDVDAAIKLNSNLSATPKISLLRARDVINESYFLFIPSNRYSLDLRYDQSEFFSLKNAYLESGLQYVSRQMFSPRVVSVREFKGTSENDADPFNGDASIFDFAEPPDGYYLLKIAAGFSIKSENVQYDFRLSAENLLNHRYRDYTNRFRYYANDLGRNVIFSVKCIF
jgi:iron complex outermembrane recepter protein